LWFLEIDRRVDVCYRIAARPDESQCVLEKNRAFDVLPAFLGIRKVRTNIAEGKRTKQGIGYRVHKDIGVGVSVGPEFRFDLDAANDEWTASYKPVNVISETDPMHSLSSSPPLTKLRQ